MNGQELTAAIVGHVLSWPTMAAVIVFILRKPIGTLLGELKRASAQGFEFEFHRGAEQAAVKMQSLPPAPVSDSSRDEADDGGTGQGITTGRPPYASYVARVKAETNVDPLGRALDLAGTKPRAAVIAAWRVMEGEVATAAQHRGQLADPPRYTAALAALVEDGIVSDEFEKLIEDLHALASGVEADTATIDVRDAYSYVNTVRHATLQLGLLVVMHDEAARLQAEQAEQQGRPANAANRDPEGDARTPVPA